MRGTLPDRCGTFTIGGHPVTRLGLGTAQMSASGVWSHPTDAAEAARVLRQAVDLGVNLIDIAESSGPFNYEELIAQALNPYPENLLLMIKGGLLRSPDGQWEPVPRPSFLRKQIDTRLWYLKLNRIPLFQLHGFSPHAPVADQIGLLTDMQREGKIGQIGLAEVTVAELEEARKFAEIATVQAEYNLINRAAEPLLNYAEEANIGFIPWLPLATGALASQDGPLAELARRRSVTPAQLALAWLLKRSPAMLPTPGTLSMQHLNDNVSAVDIALTATEVDDLDRSIPRIDRLARSAQYWR
ncbi:aldo/keto reductase [Kutzneria kofuensis]|uniref:Aryl-alcohol dehydrogenase-like predicted oxidoreductase n=1 Tax=Kutzneria kofuensis TaxID=103725 RepID=A0A7W9KPN1_9PSEU|nr:aldo/keto reductase [Kutzneria kofuensis]MBB5896416.1 aryl-alcohol dehydrogenase-like predicted oxidoreductase [Kutzneria kofuensis]